MFGKMRKKDRELEYLRNIATEKFAYRVQGQAIVGPCSFADLYLMAKYGGGTLEIHEEVARGVGISMTIYDARYENVTEESPEKL